MGVSRHHDPDFTPPPKAARNLKPRQTYRWQTGLAQFTPITTTAVCLGTTPKRTTTGMFGTGKTDQSHESHTAISDAGELDGNLALRSANESIIYKKRRAPTCSTPVRSTKTTASVCRTEGNAASRRRRSPMKTTKPRRGGRAPRRAFLSTLRSACPRPRPQQPARSTEPSERHGHGNRSSGGEMRLVEHADRRLESQRQRKLKQKARARTRPFPRYTEKGPALAPISSHGGRSKGAHSAAWRPCASPGGVAGIAVYATGVGGGGCGGTTIKK